MITITFDPEKHTKSYQDSCSICLSDFNPGEQVVETACKHLFHPGECLNDNYVRCPPCLTLLSDRDITFSREDVKNEVTKLIENLPQISSFFNIHNANYVFERCEVERSQGVVLAPMHNVFRMLKELNQNIPTFFQKSNKELEILIEKHTFFWENMIIDELKRYPVTLENHRTLKESSDSIFISSMALNLNEIFLDKYAFPLFKKLSTSARLTGIFKERNAAFVNLMTEKLMPLNTRERCWEIYKLRTTQKELLADVEIAKTALKVDLLKFYVKPALCVGVALFAWFSHALFISNET